ncbi:MAG: phosphopantothenoylcysteine decarboxylase [Limisphaerales bacterium]
MRCVVTAGPTIEPLDEVRRLTNFSTGSLGTELANHLAAAGHEVVLLRGEQATTSVQASGVDCRAFSSTQNLAEQFQELSTTDVGALFHASAVSDFTFGRIWETDSDGARREVTGGKISTRSGSLLAELVPTPKLISQLRAWYPDTHIFGWKYEVDGARADMIKKGLSQIHENKTDHCIINGAAYGEGFGLLGPDGAMEEIADRPRLYGRLAALLA